MPDDLVCSAHTSLKKLSNEPPVIKSAGNRNKTICPQPAPQFALLQPVFHFRHRHSDVSHLMQSRQASWKPRSQFGLRPASRQSFPAPYNIKGRTNSKSIHNQNKLMHFWDIRHGNNARTAARQNFCVSKNHAARRVLAHVFRHRLPTNAGISIDPNRCVIFHRIAN